MELEALGSIDDGTSRIALDGPVIMLRNGMVQPLALALHELATNARKYGALSDNGGHLRVFWERRDEDEPRLILVWQETGLQRVDPNCQRSGFGRNLIEKALPYQLGGETDFRLGRDSLCCTIAIPLLNKWKSA